MTLLAWIIFLCAASLEVGGDAVIRKGIRGGGMLYVAAGFLLLGLYGVVVNTVRWDFSRLLGVYVAVFALISVLAGRFVFRETVPVSTWLGLGLIIAGGAVIQWGSR
jgi:drug/metabolite transporter superfamily protein YnfA